MKKDERESLDQYKSIQQNKAVYNFTVKTAGRHVYSSYINKVKAPCHRCLHRVTPGSAVFSNSQIVVLSGKTGGKTVSNEETFTCDNYNQQLSMVFTFNDQYGNELETMESGWSNYQVYVYQEGSESVDSARADFDVSVYKNGLRFTLDDNTGEANDFKLLTASRPSSGQNVNYKLKVKATKDGQQYTNTYTVIMLGEDKLDSVFDNGAIDVTKTTIKVTKSSTQLNCKGRKVNSYNYYAYIKAGETAELTLEVRTTSGKLLKRWYDDKDLKNAIKVTGAGLTEEDYSITRGGIYGTYKISFTRTKANYGRSLVAYLKNRQSRNIDDVEDTLKFSIDLNSKISQADNF
jgi:hypothetical protein